MIGIKTAICRVSQVWLAVVMACAASMPVSAQSCTAASFATVCRCSNCLYVVLCGFSISLNPTMNFSVCTGDNPGFVTKSWKATFSGLDSTLCAYHIGCGTATVSGNCCGGARTVVMDFEGYTTCVPAGKACGTTGTLNNPPA